jgi:hypothetical protein
MRLSWLVLLGHVWQDTLRSTNVAVDSPCAGSFCLGGGGDTDDSRVCVVVCGPGRGQVWVSTPVDRELDWGEDGFCWELKPVFDTVWLARFRDETVPALFAALSHAARFC